MELPLHTDLILNGVVAVLLLITVIYCLILNRRLTALRGNQDEMRQLLSQFTLATRQAEASVSELKEASDQIGVALGQRVTEARALADELTSITQSGNNLADRIERGLVGRGSPERSTATAEVGLGASATLSESERELAEILRQAR